MLILSLCTYLPSLYMSSLVKLSDEAHFLKIECFFGFKTELSELFYEKKVTYIFS